MNKRSGGNNVLPVYILLLDQNNFILASYSCFMAPVAGVSAQAFVSGTGFGDDACVPGRSPGTQLSERFASQVGLFVKQQLAFMPT